VGLPEAPIRDSAHRHGIFDTNIGHAPHHILDDAGDPKNDDVTLFLGPATDNNLIEVGVLDTDEGPSSSTQRLPAYTIQVTNHVAETLTENGQAANEIAERLGDWRWAVAIVVSPRRESPVRGRHR